MEQVVIALALSLKVAGWSTAINLLFGVAAGYGLSRINKPMQLLLDTVFTLPMVLPPTVIGYYLLIVFGGNSVLGKWLAQTWHFSLMFTWQGAVVAASVVSFPLVFKAAYTAFVQADRTLEDAGRVIGLNGLAVFWMIALPLAWRAILAGALLAFARSLGEFGATLMVAGSIAGQTQTLSLAVWEAVQAGHDQLAQFLVSIIVLVSLTLLLSINFLNRKKSAYA